METFLKKETSEKVIRFGSSFICVLLSLSISLTSVEAAGLLDAGGITYEGAFAVPQESGMLGGGACLSMSKTGNLYICGANDQVTEISIPTPVNSLVVGDLPRANLLHSYVDITNGIQVGQENSTGGGPYDSGDILVVGDNICWTMYEYYNVDGTDHLNFGCTESLDASVSFGPWHIGPFSDGPPLDYFHAMQTSDYLAHSRNPNCLLSGRTRAAGAFGASSGPALYEFCPSNISQAPGTAIDSASILMTFPTPVQLSPKYKPKDMWRGVAVVDKTVLMVVRKALGPVFYKHDPRGWSYPDDQPPVLCSTEGGGYHAGPYEAQIQMFDWDVLQEVKDGLRDPWNVLPYLTFPIPGWWDTCTQEIGDMAYDPVSGRLYLTQQNVEGNRPLVHVYRVTQSGGVVPDGQAPLAPTGFQVK